MGQALKLAVAMLAMGWGAPAFSAQQASGVRPVDVEINKLDVESDRLKEAGQYDAALAAALKMVQLAEGADGADAERVGYFHTRVGSLYLSKGDRVGAEAAYRRALAILDRRFGPRLPAWGCYIPVQLAKLSRLEAQIPYYERAVPCYEALAKPGSATAIDAVIELAHFYRYWPERTQLVAKAGPLIDRWIPIAVRDLGPDHHEVAELWRGRADAYHAMGDKAGARAARLRALDILSRGAGPAKGDRAKLKIEQNVLVSLKGMYGPDDIDETYVGYQARYVAVVEQIENPTSGITASARAHLASLRERFPNWRPPSEAARTPVPVRQAVVPPVTPSPSGSAATGPGRRVTPPGTVLRAPPGYAWIKPAQLYSISVEALGDPRWIVARSKAEAMDIGNRFFAGYDRFNGCLKACESTIELDFGWVAIIQAFRPGNPNVLRDTRQFGVYVAYGAGSRQAAIDGALAEYRSKRGSEGPIAQSIRVGLVSEIDWPAIEAEFKRTAGPGSEPNMGQLNYLTYCDWGNVRITSGPIAGALGPNMNPEPTTGDLDRDPKCKTHYRPGEKLPLPVLVAGKR